MLAGRKVKWERPGWSRSWDVTTGLSDCDCGRVVMGGGRGWLKYLLMLGYGQNPDVPSALSMKG